MNQEENTASAKGTSACYSKYSNNQLNRTTVTDSKEKYGNVMSEFKNTKSDMKHYPHQRSDFDSCDMAMRIKLYDDDTPALQKSEETTKKLEYKAGPRKSSAYNSEIDVRSFNDSGKNFPVRKSIAEKAQMFETNKAEKGAIQKIDNLMEKKESLLRKKVAPKPEIKIKSANIEPADSNFESEVLDLCRQLKEDLPEYYRFEQHSLDNKSICLLANQNPLYEKFQQSSSYMNDDLFSSFQLFALAHRYAQHSKLKLKSDSLRELKSSTQLSTLVLQKAREMASKLNPEKFESRLLNEELRMPLKKELLNTLEKSIRDYKSIILFAGETKAGKSSLVNAILGVEILPVSSSQCTSTVLEVVYSEKPYMKFFTTEEIQNSNSRKKSTDDHSVQDFLEKLVKTTEFKSDREVAKILDDINKDIEKRKETSKFSRIQIGISGSKFLKESGIRIADSPGISDSEESVILATNRYILHNSEKLVALVMILNSNSAELPFKSKELVANYINRNVDQQQKEFKAHKNYVLFVGTKLDSLNSLEDMNSKRQAMINRIAAEGYASDSLFFINGARAGALSCKIERIFEDLEIFLKQLGSEIASSTAKNLKRICEIMKEIDNDWKLRINELCLFKAEVKSRAHAVLEKEASLAQERKKLNTTIAPKLKAIGSKMQKDLDHYITQYLKELLEGNYGFYSYLNNSAEIKNWTESARKQAKKIENAFAEVESIYISELSECLSARILKEHAIERISQSYKGEIANFLQDLEYALGTITLASSKSIVQRIETRTRVLELSFLGNLFESILNLGRYIANFFRNAVESRTLAKNPVAWENEQRAKFIQSLKNHIEKDEVKFDSKKCFDFQSVVIENSILQTYNLRIEERFLELKKDRELSGKAAEIDQICILIEEAILPFQEVKECMNF